MLPIRINQKQQKPNCVRKRITNVQNGSMRCEQSTRGPLCERAGRARCVCAHLVLVYGTGPSGIFYLPTPGVCVCGGGVCCRPISRYMPLHTVQRPGRGAPRLNYTGSSKGVPLQVLVISKPKTAKKTKFSSWRFPAVWFCFG